MTAVLLVDDEPAVLRCLSMWIRRKCPGWTCTTAPGGEEALRELARAPYDVVISDMRMPGLDGAELLDRIASSYPETVRIALSGHASAAAMDRARACSQEFLSKPCTGSELVCCIERLLREAAPSP